MQISQQVRAFMVGEHFTEALVNTTEALQDLWVERQHPLQNVQLLHSKGSHVSNSLKSLKEKLKTAL